MVSVLNSWRVKLCLLRNALKYTDQRTFCIYTISLNKLEKRNDQANAKSHSLAETIVQTGVCVTTDRLSDAQICSNYVSHTSIPLLPSQRGIPISDAATHLTKPPPNPHQLFFVRTFSLMREALSQQQQYIARCNAMLCLDRECFV